MASAGAGTRDKRVDPRGVKGRKVVVSRDDIKNMDPEERRKIAKRDRERLRRVDRERQRVLADLAESGEVVGSPDAVVKTGWAKPIEEWDVEELMKGRPRDADGVFRGRAPKYIDRAIYEEAIRKFQDHARDEMRGLVPKALAVIEEIMTSDAEDDRGRPVVPASVKLDAAKWTVEHLIGKATQPVDVDISVRLQGILANVMVSPQQAHEEEWLGASRVPALVPAIGRDLVGLEMDDEVHDEARSEG